MGREGVGVGARVWREVVGKIGGIMGVEVEQCGKAQILLFCLYFIYFATISCTQIQRAIKLPLYFAGKYDII